MVRRALWSLLKRPFFGAFMVPWRDPLEPSARAQWTPLAARSASGVDLVVWFAAARAPARGTVVLAHPMGKEAKAYFLRNGYADLLRDAGLNVVLFDFNGFGESPHGSFDYHEDALAAGRAARAHAPGLPLAYHGISLGAQWGALAFADPAHPFDLAILESGATSLPEFWVRFPVARVALAVLSVLLPRYRRRVHMVERFREARGLQHVLFVYSRADEWTPVEMGERYHAACAVPATLWVLEAAGHARVMRSSERDAYVARVLAFYDEHL